MKFLCLTAAQQCGKIRANGPIEDCPDDFIVAALAKPTAFPPWLTFYQIVNEVRAIGGKLMALFFFTSNDPAKL
jgi:hypothetical protein